MDITPRHLFVGLWSAYRLMLNIRTAEPVANFICLIRYAIEQLFDPHEKRLTLAVIEAGKPHDTRTIGNARVTFEAVCDSFLDFCELAQGQLLT